MAASQRQTWVGNLLKALKQVAWLSRTMEKQSAKFAIARQVSRPSEVATQAKPPNESGQLSAAQATAAQYAPSTVKDPEAFAAEIAARHNLIIPEAVLLHNDSVRRSMPPPSPEVATHELAQRELVGPPNYGPF